MKTTISRSSNGFTLIEVMVALTIAALGLAAVAASVSQMIDAATSMQQRTYADWIAQNRIVEMRLANVLPDVSSTTGEVQYAGIEWGWRSTVSETGIENLYRIDVAVSIAGTEDPIRTVTGFIGEPGVPGQANLAWTRYSLDSGERK